MISGIQLPNPSKKIICKAYILDKSKKQISRIYIIKTLFIFKLIHVDTIYITLNNINNIIEFSNFTNNYSKYQNININTQKNNIF